MKRNLPALTFATSILGLRLGITLDGFYSGLRQANLYTAPNLSHLDSLGYDFNKLKEEDCRMDSDLDPELPLIIAFDANANINWIVVGQVGDDTKLRIVNSLFTKYDRKLRSWSRTSAPIIGITATKVSYSTTTRPLLRTTTPFITTIFMAPSSSL